MSMLALADFAGMDESAAKEHISLEFGVEPEKLADISILVAYMSVGDYGCDSSAFIVFKRDGDLYEVNASHCSCFGFDAQDYSGTDGTQWEPEIVPDVSAILQRTDWSLASGGYDEDQAGNAAKIRAHLSSLSGLAS
jgi:hypothetical protein